MHLWENIAINDMAVPFVNTNYDTLEKYYGNIDYKSGFILINEYNEVLVVHQFTGNTGFPKGSRDINDKSAYDTAVRELFEETNICIDSKLVLPNIFHFHRNKCKELMIYFVAIVCKDIKITTDGREIIGHEWVNKSELKSIKKKSIPTTKICNILADATIDH
jgi:8-oxo-dGTP pyrophosphatase MutT (NUDIX family)